ncbi:MAG: hypothetical protein AB1921_10145 [Thermodesulfobacteriota bacterium]
MDLRTQIQSLFKEAEIYRQQGLLSEAKAKYQTVIGLLQKNPNIKNQQQLLDAISKKVKAVQLEMRELEDALGPDEEVSGNVQDLVKGFFASPADDKDKGAAAFKGAIALAQLRQFERALAEFSKLLDVEEFRINAAKNALKCHLALSSVDGAVNQFNEWVKDGRFTNEQVEGVRVFFEDFMKKKGMPVNLARREEAAPKREEAPVFEEPSFPGAETEVTGLKIAPSAAEIAAEAAAEEALEGEQIEICSLEITPEAGPRLGQPIEFDVSAQTGNRLTITVPARDAAYIEGVEVGQRLNKLQFFSHFVMFWGTGIVLAKRKIESGTRKGDWTLSIRMENPGTMGG